MKKLLKINNRLRVSFTKSRHRRQGLKGGIESYTRTHILHQSNVIVRGPLQCADTCLRRRNSRLIFLNLIVLSLSKTAPHDCATKDPLSILAYLKSCENQIRKEQANNCRSKIKDTRGRFRSWWYSPTLLTSQEEPQANLLTLGRHKWLCERVLKRYEIKIWKKNRCKFDPKCVTEFASVFVLFDHFSFTYLEFQS